MKYFKIALITFLSLIFLIGSTFGVMYLTGTFENDIVKPQHIAFDFSSYELDYDNENNFVVWATVTSQTVGVTETEIRLSFVTEGMDTSEVDDDYITDGVIIVPKKIRIGVPFLISPYIKLYGAIETDPNYDPEYPEGWNWIAGGVSNLKAESYSNILLNAAYSQVNVDIPVRRIEVQAFSEETQTTNFAVGSVVTLSAKFYPAESQNALGVTKQVLYEIKDHQANILDFKRDVDVFGIDDTKFYNQIEVYSQTNENPIDIEAYTFKTIIEQRRAIQEGFSESQLLIEMGHTKTSFFQQMPANEDPNIFLLSFYEPVIQNFSIFETWTQYNKITLPFNKLVTLYANNPTINNENATIEFDLGLSIIANNGQELPGKKTNIVLIPESSADGITWTYDDAHISGAEPKVQILNTQQQTVALGEENFVTGFKINTESAWRLVGQQPADFFRFRVVYLKEDSTLLTNSASNVISQYIYFNVPSASIQVQVAWTDSKPEMLEIMKSENPGETTYPSFNLRSILSVSPNNAVYQTVRYFVKGDIDNAFAVNQIVDATYYGMIEGAEIYELNPYANGVITGLRSGKVTVFAAIIKTNYAGNPIFDETGAYIFVGSTTDKSFEFSELISILNVSLEGNLIYGEIRHDLNQITQETNEAIIVRVSLPQENAELYKASFLQAFANGDISIWSTCLTAGENPETDLLQFQTHIDDSEAGVIKLLFNVNKFPTSVVRDDLTFRVNISYTANTHIQINYGVRSFRVISGLAGGVFFEVTKNEDGTNASFGTSAESRIKIEAAFSQATQSYTVVSNSQDVKMQLFEVSNVNGVSTVTTIPRIGFVNEDAHNSYKIYTITSSDPSVCEVRTQSIGSQVSYFLEYKSSDGLEHNFTLTVRLSSNKEDDKFQTIYLSYKGPQAEWETDIVGSYDIYGNFGESITIPSLVRLTNGMEDEAKEDYTAQFVSFSTTYTQEATNPPIVMQYNGIFNYDDKDEQYNGVTMLTINANIWQELKIVINCSTEFGFFYSFEIKIISCINFSTSMPKIKAEDETDPNALPVAYSSTSHAISVFANKATGNGVVTNAFYDNLQLEVAFASSPNTILNGPFEVFDRPQTDFDLFRYFLNPERTGGQVSNPIVELFFGAAGEQITLRIFFKFNNIPGFRQYIDVVLKPNITNATLPLNSTPGTPITNNLNDASAEYYSDDVLQLVSQDGLAGVIDAGDALSFAKIASSLAQQQIANTTYNFNIYNVGFNLYAFSTVYGEYVLINTQQLQNQYHAKIEYDEDNQRFVLQIFSSLSSQTMFRIDFIYGSGTPISFSLTANPNLKAIAIETVGENTVYTHFEQTLYNGVLYHKVVAAEEGVNFSGLEVGYEGGIDFLTGNFSEYVDGVLQTIDKANLSALIVSGSIDTNFARIGLLTKKLLINSENINTTIRTFEVVVNKHDPNNTSIILAQIRVRFLLLPFDVERIINYTDAGLKNVEGVNMLDIYQVLSNSAIFASYEGGSGTVNLLQEENQIPISLYLNFVNPNSAPSLYVRTFSLLNHTNIVGLSINTNGDFTCPALPETIIVLIQVLMKDNTSGSDFSFVVRIKVTASLSAQILYPYNVGGQASAEWRIMSGNSLTINLAEKFVEDVPAYLAGIPVSNGQRQRIMFFSNQNTYMSNLQLTYSIHQVWNEVDENGGNGVLMPVSQTIASITSAGVLTINKQTNVNGVKVVVKVSTLYGTNIYYNVIAEVQPSSNYQLTGPASLELLSGIQPLHLIANEGETPTQYQFELFNNSEFIIGNVTDELGFYVVNPTESSFSLSLIVRTDLKVGSQVPINPIQKTLVVFTKYGVARTVPLTLLSDFVLYFNDNSVSPNEVKTLHAYSDSVINILDLLRLLDLDGNQLVLKEDGTVYLNNSSVLFNKTTYSVPTLTGDQFIFEMENETDVKIGGGGEFTINALTSEQVVRISATFAGSVLKKIGLDTISLNTAEIVKTSTDGLTLKSLAFEALPQRAYFQNDELSYASLLDMKLVGIYSDGVARRINLTAEELISSALPTTEKTGNKIINLSYGGITLEFDIIVIKKNTTLNNASASYETTLNPLGDLVNIHIASLPNKTSYFVDEPLDLSGLVVVGEYNNGSAVTYSTIQGFAVPSNLTASTSIKQAVTVSYETFETTFYIEVIDPNVLNDEQIIVNTLDPLRITFDLIIHPNITPRKTQSLDYLVVNTFSNQEENGLTLHYSDIFKIEVPSNYFETEDTEYNINKAYYTFASGNYERFAGNIFDSKTTYYEVESPEYITNYEIISGEYTTISTQQELVASFSATQALNTIEHSNNKLIVYLRSVAGEHAITIRVTTVHGHMNLVRIVVNPDVIINVNYPGEGQRETIYYDDYTAKEFNLRTAPNLFIKNRVEALYAIGDAAGSEIAQNRFTISKIELTSSGATININQFPADQTEAVYIIGAFTLNVSKYGSFVVTAFNHAIYQPTSIRIFINIDGIHRLFYDVLLSNVPVYSFEAALTDPQRVESGKELFATKPDGSNELVFTSATIGMNKKYAVKYLGINIVSINNYDQDYLNKIIVANYPINQTSTMAEFAIKAGETTVSAGVSLQFMFVGEKAWSTTHQIKVVWDYLIRNKTISVFAGVETNIIAESYITERFSTNAIDSQYVEINGTDRTASNLNWFSYFESHKTFKAKQINGVVNRVLSIEIFGTYEEILVEVVQTAQIFLADRTFEEVYFYNQNNDPISMLSMNIYENATTSNFLELSYTNGAQNPYFAGGELFLSYEIVVLDLFGNIAFNESEEQETNPFAYISTNSLTFIKPKFSRQQVVLRVTQEFYVKDFIFYVSANEEDQITFQDNDEVGLFEGDDLPMVTGLIAGSNPPKNYPYSYQASPSWASTWEDKDFTIDYKSVSYGSGILIKKEESQYNISLLGNEFFKVGNGYSNKPEDIIVTVSISYTGANGLTIIEKASAITVVWIKQRYSPTFIYDAGNLQVVRNGKSFVPTFKVYDLKESNRLLTNADVEDGGNSDPYVKTFDSQILYTATYELVDGLSERIVLPYSYSINLGGVVGDNVPFIVYTNYKVAPYYSEIIRSAEGTGASELFSDWKSSYDFNYINGSGEPEEEATLDVTNATLVFEFTKGSTTKVYVDQWGNITGLWNVDNMDASPQQVINIREKLTGYLISTITVTRNSPFNTISYSGSAGPIYTAEFNQTISAGNFTIGGLALDDEGISFSQTSGFAASLNMPYNSGDFITVFIKRGGTIVPVGFKLTPPSLFVTEQVVVSGQTGLKITGINSKTVLDVETLLGVSELVIPNMIGGLPVLEIGENAFANIISQITSVRMGANVINIGSGAFKDAVNMTSLILNSLELDINGNYIGYISSLKSIGASAFEGCNSLLVVEIPNTVTSIGNFAFKGCTNLHSVSISKQTTNLTIGEEAFASCTSLTKIYLPNGLTALSSGVFSNCSSLTEFIVENNHPVFSVLNGNLLNKSQTVFIQYASGKIEYSFTTPALVTEIAPGAFKGADRLTFVFVRNIVTKIGAHAFEGIGGNIDVTIRIESNSSITEIGYKAFYGISKSLVVYVDSVAAPLLIGENGNVVKIGSELVDYYDETRIFEPTIYVPNKKNYLGKTDLGWTDELLAYVRNSPTDQSYFITTETTTEVTIVGLTIAGQQLESITIPNTMYLSGSNKNVVKIETAVFRGNKVLEYLYIPRTVTDISVNAFEDCVSLQTVEFGKNSGLTEIKDALFKNCISLFSIIYYGSADNTVTIPSSITTIGVSAFEGCLSIIKFVIPTSLTLIHETALLHCSSIMLFEIYGTGSTNFSVDPENRTIGEIIGVNEKALRFFAVGNSASFTLPSDYTHISNYAFYKSQSSNIYLNEGITHIGQFAFQKSKLTLISFPSSIYDISPFAFAECYNLRVVNNNSSVALTADMFGNESYVIHISIDLTNAASKIVRSYASFITIAKVFSIYIINAEIISESAFVRYANIGSTTIITNTVQNLIIDENSGLTTIRASAFESIGASTILLPSTVSFIGAKAFYNNINLTEITLPVSISLVGNSAFAKCGNLKTLTIKSPTFIPTIDMFATRVCFIFWFYTEQADLRTIAFDYSGAMPSTSYTSFINYFSSIRTVRLGAGITDVGNNLVGANNVTSFEVIAGSENFSADTHLYNLNKTTFVRYAIGAPGNSFTLPDIVSTIAPNAFANVKFATLEITAASNLIDIGTNAFVGSSIRTVFLRKAYSSSFVVGTNVFAYNSNLRVYVPFTSFTHYRIAFEVNNNSSHVQNYLKPILQSENLTKTSNSFITPFIENITQLQSWQYYGFVMPNIYNSGILKANIVISSTGMTAVYMFVDGVLTAIPATSGKYSISLGVQHIVAIDNASSFSIGFAYDSMQLFEASSLTGEINQLNVFQFTPSESKGYFASNFLSYRFDSTATSTVKVFTQTGSEISVFSLQKNVSYYVLGYVTNTSGPKITVAINSVSTLTGYGDNTATKVANISTYYTFVPFETATFIFTVYPSTVNKRIALYDSGMNQLALANGTNTESGSFSYVCIPSSTYYIGLDNKTQFSTGTTISWGIQRLIVENLTLNNMYKDVTVASNTRSNYVRYFKFTPSITQAHAISVSVTSGSGHFIELYNSSYTLVSPDNVVANNTYYIRFCIHSANATGTIRIYYVSLPLSQKLTIGIKKGFTATKYVKYRYYFIATKSTHNIVFSNMELAVSKQELMNNTFGLISTSASWSGLTAGQVYFVDVWYELFLWLWGGDTNYIEIKIE